MTAATAAAITTVAVAITAVAATTVAVAKKQKKRKPLYFAGAFGSIKLYYT